MKSALALLSVVSFQTLTNLSHAAKLERYASIDTSVESSADITSADAEADGDAAKPESPKPIVTKSSKPDVEPHLVDNIPETARAQIVERIQIVLLLAQKTGKAYDYKQIPLSKLRKLAQEIAATP